MRTSRPIQFLNRSGCFILKFPLSLPAPFKSMLHLQCPLTLTRSFQHPSGCRFLSALASSPNNGIHLHMSRSSLSLVSKNRCFGHPFNSSCSFQHSHPCSTVSDWQQIISQHGKSFSPCARTQVLLLSDRNCSRYHAVYDFHPDS